VNLRAEPFAVRERLKGIKLRTLIGAGLVLGWIAYVGITAYVVWRILSHDAPSFVTNYTIGTNATWVMMGIMLWLATEWMRGFRS
jgi:hypothetical protein